MMSGPENVLKQVDRLPTPGRVLVPCFNPFGFLVTD